MRAGAARACRSLATTLILHRPAMWVKANWWLTCGFTPSPKRGRVQGSALAPGGSGPLGPCSRPRPVGTLRPLKGGGLSSRRQGGVLPENPCRCRARRRRPRSGRSVSGGPGGCAGSRAPSWLRREERPPPGPPVAHRPHRPARVVQPAATDLPLGRCPANSGCPSAPEGLRVEHRWPVTSFRHPVAGVSPAGLGRRPSLVHPNSSSPGASSSWSGSRWCSTW